MQQTPHDCRFIFSQQQPPPSPSHNILHRYSRLLWKVTVILGNFCDTAWEPCSHRKQIQKSCWTNLSPESHPKSTPLTNCGLSKKDPQPWYHTHIVSGRRTTGEKKIWPFSLFFSESRSEQRRVWWLQDLLSGKDVMSASALKRRFSASSFKLTTSKQKRPAKNAQYGWYFPTSSVFHCVMSKPYIYINMPESCRL